MRRIIEATGEQLGQVNWASTMGLTISALALLRAYNLFEIQITSIWILLLIILGIIIVPVFVVSIFQAISYGIIALSESIPANVDIVASEHMDEDDIKAGTQRFFATLKIRNKELYGLTNCYAILREAQFAALKSHEGPLNRPEGKRVRWKDSLESEITIGPRTGEATLRVFQSNVSLKDHKLLESDFCVFEGGQSKHTTILRAQAKYRIVIEFFGRVRGKDVKINSFVGYIEPQFSSTDSEMAVSIAIYPER